MSNPEDHPRWRESIRRIIDCSLALMRNRLEIVAVEFQEEKLRLLTLLVWLGLAMTLGAAGLLVIVAALAIWTWGFAGYAGLAVLAAILLGGAAWVLLFTRKQIQTAPPPFSATAAEFRKDAACLRKN